MSQLPPPTRTAKKPTPADEYDEGSFDFLPATKDGHMARLSIQGPSGCGKTWTGLQAAAGLAEGREFAVIDTERRAASLYIDDLGVAFKTLAMRTYDPRDLRKALASAASKGFPAVMVDSLSHFWHGTGGTLDQVDRAASKYGGNKFAGWKDGGELQNDMIEALMAYPGHVVVTMRSSVKWVLEENERGQKAPINKGMRAQQRDGIEFEFGVAAEMDRENSLWFIKTRCPVFQGARMKRPHGARDIAKPYLDWLRSGAKEIDPSVWVDAASSSEATADGLLALYREVEAASALATPLMHPETGQPTSLGAYIKERGTALKAAQ